MVEAEVSGPSVETTEEDEVLLLADGSNQVGLVVPQLSLSGERWEIFAADPWPITGHLLTVAWVCVQTWGGSILTLNASADPNPLPQCSLPPPSGQNSFLKGLLQSQKNQMWVSVSLLFPNGPCWSSELSGSVEPDRWMVGGDEADFGVSFGIVSTNLYFPALGSWVAFLKFVCFPEVDQSGSSRYIADEKVPSWTRLHISLLFSSDHGWQKLRSYQAVEWTLYLLVNLCNLLFCVLNVSWPVSDVSAAPLTSQQGSTSRWWNPGRAVQLSTCLDD